jgi:hypothetical protein
MISQTASRLMFAFVGLGFFETCMGTHASALELNKLDSRQPSLNISFLTEVCGTAVVTTDNVPIRSEYPDGRIVAVVNKGFVINLRNMSGDGRGTWVQVDQNVDGKAVHGFIDAGMTTVWSNAQNGHLNQPVQKPDGSRACP